MIHEDWLKLMTRAESLDPNRAGQPIEIPSKVPTAVRGGLTEDALRTWVDSPENRITAKLLLDIYTSVDGGAEMFQYILSGGGEGACMRKMLSMVSPQKKLDFGETPSTEVSDISFGQYDLPSTS
eukprot:SAG11_NODE_457_length_9306_cov_2.887803_8_plen_125_part_00